MRWVMLALSITIASCGSDVDDQSIDGLWMMPCAQSRGEVQSSGGPAITYYSAGHLQFDEGMVSGSAVEYTDSECTQPLADGPTLALTGTYTIGERLINGDGVSVTAIDLNLTPPGLDATLTYKTIYRIEGGMLYLGQDRLHDPSQTPDTPPEEELLDLDYPLLRTQGGNSSSAHAVR